MTRKERIVQMVQRQNDNVAYSDIIRRLIDMQEIEVALEQVERGEIVDHDEVFAKLEKEWPEIESSGRKQQKKLAPDPKLDRQRRPPHGRGLRKALEGRNQCA